MFRNVFKHHVAAIRVAPGSLEAIARGSRRSGPYLLVIIIKQKKHFEVAGDVLLDAPLQGQYEVVFFLLLVMAQNLAMDSRDIVYTFFCT